ncbi:hypothetical protein ACFLUO_03420 [Chloroflexota bacterium]
MEEKIHQDKLTEMETPIWTLVRAAIKSGKTDDALKLFDEAHRQSENNNNRLTSFVEQSLTHLAGFGEDELEKVIRERYYDSVRDWIAEAPSVEDELKKCTDSQKGHHANFKIIDEPDRYVVIYDPCGTGGKLRRTRSVGTTKKAYPWAFGKSGVPYYCTHCCIHFETLPTEMRGYPIKITLIADKPEDPCVHLFYKKPELIPEEYFTRIGYKKTIK